MLFRRRARSGNLRRYRTITVIALSPVIAGIGIWLLVADIDPDVTVPTPVLPVPNAYNDYMAASAAVVPYDGSASPVDKHNPHVEFISDIASSVEDSGNLREPVTVRKMERVVQMNRPMLAMVRRGFSRPYHAPPVRSFAGAGPCPGKLVVLGDVLILDGHVKAVHGDYPGAMNSYLDAVQLGQEIPRGAARGWRWTGMWMQGDGRQLAWDIVSRLDGPGARRAARRMEEIHSREFPYAETLREEMWCDQAALAEIMRNDEYLLVYSWLGQNNVSGWYVIAPEVLCRLTGKRRTLNNFTRYMEQCIARANLPYAAHVPQPPLPPDPLTRPLLERFVKERFYVTGLQQTQNALLTVTLALQAYRAERGTYPNRLAELTPSYLKSIPKDPFTMNAPLRYRRTNGAACVLYSIGPDGIDNHGTAVDDPDKRGGRFERYEVEEESIGDIVAGVNRR